MLCAGVQDRYRNGFRERSRSSVLGAPRVTHNPDCEVIFSQPCKISPTVMSPGNVSVGLSYRPSSTEMRFGVEVFWRPVELLKTLER